MKRLILFASLFLASCKIPVSDEEKLKSLKCPVVIVAVHKGAFFTNEVILKDADNKLHIFSGESYVSRAFSNSHPGDTIK